MNGVIVLCVSREGIYTHANKKKAAQFTGFVENIYRHEHVMITKLYIVSHILFNRHLYECIL